jgi:hypothetical protein
VSFFGVVLLSQETQGRLAARFAIKGIDRLLELDTVEQRIGLVTVLCRSLES